MWFSKAITKAIQTFKQTNAPSECQNVRKYKRTKYKCIPKDRFPQVSRKPIGLSRQLSTTC